MANAAIGSRISLISKSEIRYEGFLDHINTEQNHVGLKNVRMFGTEGRKGGVNEVPASDNLYEFIIFRGGDIKDLSVFENQPRDPAIVNAKTSNIPAASQPSSSQQEPASKSAWSNGPPSDMRHNNNNNNRTYGNGRDGGNYQQQQRTYGNGRDGGNYSQNNNNNNNSGNNNSRGGYRGGYNNNNGGNNSHHHNNNGGASAGGANMSRPVQHTGQDFQVSSDPARARNEVGTNFDFSKGPNEFERAKQEARDRQRNTRSIEKYDKKDFFDNLSPDDKKNQQLDFHTRRIERENQNANDTETFGRDMVAVQHTRGFGRGRGGRGNGGGGGYRGGRGYQQNNNNNNNGGGRGQF